MDTPRIEEINEAGSSYVQMPKEVYIAMIERISDLEDMEAILEAKHLRSEEQETFPITLTKQIIEGISPVKVYRNYRGLTQQALADKASINRAYLSEIENKKKPGSIAALKSLTTALNLDLDDLV